MAFIFIVALSSVGCGKSKSPSVETSVSQPVMETTQLQSPASNLNVQSSQTASTANANAGTDLKQMDRALLKWLMANRRKPSSFEEFAATAGVPIPPPPAGKKYFIDKNMHILVVAQ